jgi:signal transduction histidine kinase
MQLNLSFGIWTACYKVLKLYLALSDFVTLSPTEQWLRRILLSEKAYSLSYSRYKRAVLTSVMALITVLSCIFFVANDLINGYSYSFLYLGLCLVLSIVSLLLNRAGFFNLARVLLALTVNATIFVFTILEPLETGQFIFYIPAAICSLVLWQSEKRAKVFFIGLPILLFLISFLFEATLVPSRVFTQHYIKTSLIINFTLAIVSSSCAVFFLMSVNYQSEKILTESNNEISKKNLELIRLNKQLDRFFYSTSHDLRGPLTSVLGLINLTEKESDIQQIKVQLGLMLNRVQYLDEIICNITDYARNVQQHVNKSTVSLSQLLEIVIAKLQLKETDTDIKISNQVSRDLQLITDGKRLETVFFNLLSNAVKYSDSTKTSQYINITEESTETAIKINIEDNGVGIPAEKLPLIFDMFVKVHERSSGAGLGLYVVKETLEKIGGSITVTSHENQGSVFTVALPKVS